MRNFEDQNRTKKNLRPKQNSSYSLQGPKQGFDLNFLIKAYKYMLFYI